MCIMESFLLKMLFTTTNNNYNNNNSDSFHLKYKYKLSLFIKSNNFRNYLLKN